MVKELSLPRRVVNTTSGDPPRQVFLNRRSKELMNLRDEPACSLPWFGWGNLWKMVLAVWQPVHQRSQGDTSNRTITTLRTNSAVPLAKLHIRRPSLRSGVLESARVCPKFRRTVPHNGFMLCSCASSPDTTELRVLRVFAYRRGDSAKNRSTELACFLTH